MSVRWQVEALAAELEAERAESAELQKAAVTGKALRVAQAELESERAKRVTLAAQLKERDEEITEQKRVLRENKLDLEELRSNAPYKCLVTPYNELVTLVNDY